MPGLIFHLSSHPFNSADLAWVARREGELYRREFGFDESFEALVATIVDDFARNFDPVRERCWIADVNGRNMGHIFLVKHPERPDTARLRLLFVEPAARGIGVGDALVKACIGFARAAGYRTILLWTQSILLSARRIYQKAGFRLIAEEPHHSFGQDLTGQTWQLDLDC